jgi:hypothetical protein
MKLTVLLAAILVAFASIASAAPLCTDIGNSDHIATMADYVALGSGGCLIGDKLFSNFRYSPTSSGTGVLVPASAVTLTPIGADSYNPGILFSSNDWIVNGSDPSLLSFVDASIGFTVTVQPGGNLIDDASLTLTSVAFTGTGSADVGETILAANGLTALGALGVDASGPLTDEVSFAPTNIVLASKDMFVGVPAGSDGTAQVFSFAENFSEIPEPVGSVLIGSGLLALGVWRRRASRG